MDLFQVSHNDHIQRLTTMYVTSLKDALAGSFHFKARDNEGQNHEMSRAKFTASTIIQISWYSDPAYASVPQWTVSLPTHNTAV